MLLSYGILILFGILSCLLYFKIGKSNDKKSSIVLKKIIPIVLILVFIARLFCYESKIYDYVGLLQTPLSSKFVTVISLFLIWFNYTAILLVILVNYFHFPSLKNMIRFITTPILFLNICFMIPTFQLFQNSLNTSVLTIIYPIELGIAFGISLYYTIRYWKEKIRGKQVLKILLLFACLLIASMPSYLPQFLFGYIKATILLKKITIAHRVVVYGAFLVPTILYFTLRNKPKDVIHFSMIYISVATLIVFLVNHNYTEFTKPWAWPFHLCNTAMFIIPICVIFKQKKLFYFTYFINVLGALLAMLMPNYGDATNLFSMRFLNFWGNHYIAFFMPILLVALHEFDRPNIKDFIYSMIWFLAYFVLALFMNVYFTAIGHSVDYFFINSDYVADKLGSWAENIFNVTTRIPVGNVTLEFHPVYQTAFFLVYVLLGAAVWFVYAEFYRIADSHMDLHQKLKKLKIAEFALQSQLNGRSMTEPMNKDAGVCYELINFSKKYASSKKYAVVDASFCVHGGEIFGFLGPNGAGKSTIIKSTVGIQTIPSGRIEICGYDVAKQPVEAKHCIGFVPDHYALYEKLTGREYINYIADIYDVTEEERNERIEKYIHRFELESSIDNKIKTYSHGMKQKITIISALIHEPKVWILDEPLTGLDPNSIFQVKECMKEHAEKGNIVFFSSHIIDVVEKICGRVAIIKHGHIQCVKSIKEIEESGVNLEQFYLNTVGDNLDDQIDVPTAVVETEVKHV